MKEKKYKKARLNWNFIIMLSIPIISAILTVAMIVTLICDPNKELLQLNIGWCLASAFLTGVYIWLVQAMYKAKLFD